MKKSKTSFAFRFIKYLNKSVALLLIFLLSTSHLMVFGEETAVSSDSTATVSSDTPALTTEEPAVSTDTTPSTEEALPGDETVPVEDDALTVKDAKVKPVKDKTAQPQALLSQPDPSTNTNLPPSTIKQLLPTADQSTGSLVYNYPISVPPGRNGVQPDLRLTYNSQKTEEGSVFGSGWSMSIPYIERLNKTGSNNLYTADTFTSSLDGEMVNISSGVYGPKVENGDFRKYSLASSVWTVTDKSGTVYTFGHTAGTRQDDPNDSTRINKWMLSEVRDTNNNYIKYEYYKDAGQIYPSKITYTGNGSTDGIFEVSFLRESRTDIVPFDKAGFNVETNYRIYEIDTKISNTLVHKYEIDYTTGDNDVRSLITTITESGIDESSNMVTLPATSFTYQANTAGWTQDTNLTIPTIFTYSNGASAGTQVLDVNGDGLQDIVRSDASASTQVIYLNNGNGWTTSSWTIPEDITDAGHGDTGFRFSDINGDNLPDIVLGKDWSGTQVKKVYINNGSGWTLDTSWTLPVVFVNHVNQDQGARIADFNSDGLIDILYSRYWGSGVYHKHAYVNTGKGWAEDTSVTIPAVFAGFSNEDWGYRTTDAYG